jgi:protein TonB
VTQTQTPNTTAATDVAKDASPLDVGSLIAYATKQSQPVYPPAARTMRTTGVVKVEVTVDENGDVTEVQHTSGPSLLQTAAKEAVRRWKFRPFTKDGQPVKAMGFVNFNFSL